MPTYWATPTPRAGWAAFSNIANSPIVSTLGGALTNQEVFHATGMESRDGGQYLGTVELAPGTHRIEVWSPDGLTKPRNISFVQAVSLEREERPGPSPVCINGRRYEAVWDRPVETDADDGSVAIENCGDVPLFGPK